MAISRWLERQKAEGSNQSAVSPPMLKARRASSKQLTDGGRRKAAGKESKQKRITSKHDLKSNLSDIDEFDLTFSSEGLDLLCKSGPRKKPKTKVTPSPLRRNQGRFSANLLQDVDSDGLL
jgi:hypothetical protein